MYHNVKSWNIDLC